MLDTCSICYFDCMQNLRAKGSQNWSQQILATGLLLPVISGGNGHLTDWPVVTVIVGLLAYPT